MSSKETIHLCDRKLESPVFGYACLSAGEECFGADVGDFSIIINKYGILEYRKYLFAEILNKETFYELPEKAINEIIEILEKHKSEIASFTDTDNGSCDGAFNYFLFGDKWVESLNIDETDDIDEVKERNPRYYDEYLENMIMENQILSVFDEINTVLKKYGVDLSLNSVKFNL